LLIFLSIDQMKMCKIVQQRILFSLILMSLFFSVPAFSQISEELSGIKTEELTDDQIKRFIVEIDRSGITDDGLEQFAIDRGMNPVEIVKLKTRIESLRKSQSSLSPGLRGQLLNKGKVLDSINRQEQNPAFGFNAAFNQLALKNFGFDVFNNPRVTFEPNLRIPTPKNYVLAADDELLIEVTGYSEASYRLKVSPEGYIRIPIAGSLNVNGLSIEQARKNIIQKLSNTIYSNIKTGGTRVDVTLGAVRSIKITIIGEANNPGTYTLPSLASAYNALYACGGLNANGSYRNIQLIRDNQLIATIDIYDYLLHGTKVNDVRLMDQDVIKINTYSTRIELKGEVKKPGQFDVRPGETLANLIDIAGGFTDQAYTAKIQVFQNTEVERKLNTLAKEDFGKTIPQKGDSYIVGKILNRYKNRISIKGAIYRPGEYELKENYSLLKLIQEADGLREDAYASRGIIQRLKDDLSPQLLAFDLKDILSGDQPDISLRKEDRITIFSKFDLKEGYYVSIEGEIASPGIFLYEEDITVKDLILLSGGLKEASSLKRIEISRRIKDADPNSSNAITATIFEHDLSQDSIGSGIDTFKLAPFDEVTIRPAPGYFVQKNVVIQGEVLYAGKFTLATKNDRISDLLKRSGGLTPEAYVRGAVLVRSKNRSKFEIDNTEQGLNNLIKQNYNAGTNSTLLQYQIESIARKKSERVGIDLQKIIDHPKSAFDLLLNDGDTLIIPKELQTVRVNGEVLYPTLVRFTDKYKFKDYVNGAGGFSDRSAKRRAYLVQANGTVKGTKSFLFVRKYPTVKPGSEIFVPIKRERERLRTIEIVSISTALVTMLAILLNVVK
jgi:protein involved in polysaccharide export with SLBB domain